MSSTVYVVTDDAQLNTAIEDADAQASGSVLIDIANSFTLTAATQAVNMQSGVDLTIEGDDFTINGAGKENGLFVYSGTVTVDDLTITDTLAQGGTGVASGGGGAGLGGGLFIASAGVVTLDNVSFSGDSAVGGNTTTTGGGDGGGGGLDGGAGSYIGGGGGIGGNAATTPTTGNGGAGIVPGAAAGGNGPAENKKPAPLGGADGGAGGSYGSIADIGGGGGGGIGGEASTGNYGGAGGFGGGGGGAALGPGGNGGFGGGGGSKGEGPTGSVGSDSGSGGFGGGGAGATTTAADGAGGFGAGNGVVNISNYDGGGGLGAGADIFAQAGATLIIEGGTAGAGTVAGGKVEFAPTAQAAGVQGQAYGSGIFLQGDETITLGTNQLAGQTTEIDGVIADETGSGGGTANPGAGALTIEGAGTVELTGANTYTGGTTVESGALALGANTAAGSDEVVMAAGTTLDFSAGGLSVANGFRLSGDPVIIVAAGDDETLSGVISDGTSGGVIEKIGGGTLDLTGANTFSGGTTVESGALELGADTAAGSDEVVMAAGTTLDFSANNLSVANAFQLSGDPVIIVAAGNDETLSGVFSDGTSPGVIEKIGGGTLDLTGANTFSGGITLYGGTLELGSASAAGTGEITFAASPVELTTTFSLADLPNNVFLDFNNDDSIVITGYQGAIQSYGPTTVDVNGVPTATDDLVLSDGTTKVNLYLNGDGSTSLSNFIDTLSASNDTTTITSNACYVRGTTILTDRGEVAIETLAIGDRVVTASGAARPIKWIGWRRVDCAAHPEPREVWPFRVAKDAFGQGQPARDLWISPRHCLVGDGALIPVRDLANGRTIFQHEQPKVEYWHVELDTHDVIFAEGLASESYLDCGNRESFENGGAFLALHPTFESAHPDDTCLPHLSEGAQVERTKAILHAQADNLGYMLTGDAAPHIFADGRRIEPVALGGRRLGFLLPEGCADIRLASRAFVPAEVEPGSQDRRELGVCVARLQVDGEDIDFGETIHFASGWREQESHGRWTDGRARLPARARMIVVDLVGEGKYRAERLTVRRDAVQA